MRNIQGWLHFRKQKFSTDVITVSCNMIFLEKLVFTGLGAFHAHDLQSRQRKENTVYCVIGQMQCQCFSAVNNLTAVKPAVLTEI